MHLILINLPCLNCYCLYPDYSFGKRKKEKYSKFTLALFGLILLASVLKLYPYFSRVALYSYPF